MRGWKFLPGSSKTRWYAELNLFRSYGLPLEALRPLFDLRISIPLVAATRAKQDPNVLSLSRMRYLGAWPYGVASRSCCAVQASVGNRVTPTWITLRDCSSIMKNAKSERKNRSVTCKQSQAHTSFAWLRRNVAQFCPLGLMMRACLI